jgi:arylsulfatase A-like enzyme
VRVPLIIKWPGVTKAGAVCDTPVITPDFYATMLEMAGLKPEQGQVVDGESVVPLLKRTGGLKREGLYWHYPHYHAGGATPYSAIRAGDWKLIEFFEDHHVELYNLKDDLGEKTDLAGKLPDKAAGLRAKLVAWRDEVGAQLPTPNPDHDPARANENRPTAKAAK